MELPDRLIRYFEIQLVRYGIVGASLSLLYVALTTLIAEITPTRPLVASVAAFALSLPVAYFGHLGLTFRRSGARRQVTRFVLAMSNAFIVSTIAMWLVDGVLSAHYAYALVATTVIVTVSNYAVLDNWVFRDVIDASSRCGK